MMKTIGMLGGITWEGSATYYRRINELVKERLGGSHSARCILHSIDFHAIEPHLLEENWQACASLLIKGARQLETGGADFLLLCTSTMHRVAEEIQAAISIPLLHIAETVAEELQNQGVRRIGLLATRYTMEQDFNTSRVASRGIEVVVPETAARIELNRIIFKELCQGIGKDASREYVLSLVDELARRDVDGIVLGCGEVGLLIDHEDAPVPLYDATAIHARSAVDLALA